MSDEKFLPGSTIGVMGGGQLGRMFAIAARRKRIAVVMLFSVLAGLGPLFVLGHHWWLTGDALAFYRGPYSPRAIQGNAD
jgi:hypothetical protein